ncbi:MULTISPECIES: 2-oxoglutarate ferredoxin oxidoreductase subunit beta [Arcobacter]|uniref:2-oxoglutarate ferredoxin oxidoreductase subunit beta n=2 Tax=Arcobacter TaxID=28196 RepID=A0A4Q0ZDM1_9BACT|nr:MULTISPECIES: 2-oxoglutarate ferredoxin oxidoreductase subunit beta [Arcobacter]MCB9096708.1 2-oxoglutarate ferredoxin oxidoreductase subunit beta [Arcobacter sp.]NCB11086.1 2-oxoglutarate ferredoxin oxidoreductase subunit beta [Erysipelotrichia bacterium]QKE25643.1 2-oxoglutarate:acceptor oxidoreductase, beta subunit [Arcobacter aquimarinus]QKF89461.1 2-oxoglutarate:acceptor oxidoreductase, beta subunit [Arcobacter cloacae]RXI35016.1 2-oxoglutarate ferredoxin oxidoreductase subunit beta [A
MAFNYDEYLRTDKMPTLWCWGCGDGVILKSVIRAIEKLGWNMDDVCVVSGIGCSGRFSSYINCNTVHTTHGRTLAYATGIKLANPDKKVIVVGGDGDGLAIGGNHTIHASRRNIDLNYIIINNFIYGLTNSQTSPTTPQGMWTVTMSRGNIDPTFDACKLVEAAGASFVARETMLDPKKLERTLVKAFEHKGFSFVEVFSNCHVNLGRKNKMATAMANLEWIDSISMAKAKFEKLEPEEQKGIFPTGILKHDTEAVEYCEAYEKVKEAHKNKTMVQL